MANWCNVSIKLNFLNAKECQDFKNFLDHILDKEHNDSLYIGGRYFINTQLGISEPKTLLITGEVRYSFHPQEALNLINFANTFGPIIKTSIFLDEFLTGLYVNCICENYCFRIENIPDEHPVWKTRGDDDYYPNLRKILKTDPVVNITPLFIDPNSQYDRLIADLTALDKENEESEMNEIDDDLSGNYDNEDLEDDIPF